MKYNYRNPWWDPDKGGHGPALFETDAEPVEYRGFKIFHRYKGCWELVLNDVCLTQRAGKRGCYSLADALSGLPNSEPAWLVERARVIMEQYNVTISHAA